MPTDRRVSGLLDGGTPYYDIYETSDGRHLSVGSLEPQFYAEMVRLLDVELPDRNDRTQYPALKAALTEVFASRTLAEWSELFANTDACVAPILTLNEAMEHEHMVARGTFIEVNGIKQPAPAPRFSRTEASVSMPPGGPGSATREALTAWGLDNVEELLANGAAVQGG